MSDSKQHELHSNANCRKDGSRVVAGVAGASLTQPFKVVLVGNPNSGKTTLFNKLASTRLHTGNYPGVTLEQVRSRVQWGWHTFDLVDLPGTYSLSAEGSEERVVHDVLVGEKPDAVVYVADASQLERHLYLAVELLELGVPLVLALNLWDVAREKGLQIDIALLSLLLGVPVVPTVARAGEGTEPLLDALARVCQQHIREQWPPLRVDYGDEIEPCLRKLTLEIGQYEGCAGCPRWHALKLLEGDEQCLRLFRRVAPARCDQIVREITGLRERIEKAQGEEVGITGVSRRYEYVKSICALVISAPGRRLPSLSIQIDRVLLSRWLGLPSFAVIMYLVFQLTFAVAQPAVGGMESLFGWLGRAVSSGWSAGSESLARSLMVDGLIGGVGGVAVFLPNILVLFLCLAVLEQSGYMVRAMFLLDRLFHRIGLPGNSFIPMMIGLGCTVPAIVATRTLRRREDRLTTILVLPLITCSTRLSIYTLIIAAFFAPRLQAPILWAAYLTGILLAIGGAKLIQVALFKGVSSPFIMELPPCRVPALNEVLSQMWGRTWSFLKTAGTVILGISILLWVLSTWPSPPAGQLDRFAQERASVQARPDLDSEQKAVLLENMSTALARLKLEHSAMGRLGQGLAPVFQPVGFDWKITTALLGSFAAREVFLAQMSVVHSVGKGADRPQTLREILQRNYTPLQGICLILFTLIGPPCMATFAITKQETQSWKWPLLQLGGLTALAYALTLLVYQLGRFLL